MKQVNYQDTPEAQLLIDAIGTINGERQDQYGNAEDSFELIAEFWSTLFGIRITASGVAEALILMKIARQMNAPKRDNILDIAGYAALLERIQVKSTEEAGN